ncbi:MAG TPA: prolyl oligopeptidase family serine peptidase, partial [Thermoanaerobaculia bacterium]|nr:prolyl oligopeptidase family serine peptidase [Thermoanaerobaculia bacterium]
MRLVRWSAAPGIALAAFLVFSCSTPAPRTAVAPPPPPTATPLPSTPTPRPYDYPSAPKGDTVDDYHGTRVPDPFRSLENAEDPSTAAWVDAENALTRRLLDRSEREALKARITELMDYPRISVPTKRGKFYFYFKNTGLQNQSIYFVQEGAKGEPRVLIDPNALSPDGTVALTSVSPTRDGSLLGYTLSRSGSDRQEIYVRDVATGKDLPDKLLWAKFTAIAWTRDKRGFYYTRYAEPGTGPADEENYFPKLCYHRLGERQTKDRIILEKPGEKEVFLGASVSYDGRWLIIQAWKGASDKSEIRVLDLSRPGAKAVPVFTGYENAYTIADVVRGRLYARTDRGAPLGRIIAVDVARGLSAKNTDAPFAEIVPASQDNIVSATIVNNQLIVDSLHNASDRLTVYDLSGRRQNDVALPGIGSIDEISGLPDQKEMFVSFTTFTVPRTNYRYDFSKRELVLFQKPDVKVDTHGYETEQAWYSSRDGTNVSIFLIHRKGLARDGDRPTWLTAYGGFNINLTPFFVSSDFVLLERGGVIAIPNLRGGGEYGEAWHQAGTREKKQNVFDDFIAAAEWLVREGWTRPARLAIEGGS